MANDHDRATPYNFASSDPRHAMHSKDAIRGASGLGQSSAPQATQPGTALVPVGPVFDAAAESASSVIREHKLGVILLAGFMGFAIGAALNR